MRILSYRRLFSLFLTTQLLALSLSGRAPAQPRSEAVKKVAEVERALKHRDAKVRTAALGKLTLERGNKAAVTRLLLRALRKDRAAKVRKQAIEVLEALNEPDSGSAGPFDALVIPALVRALDDRAAAVRLAACGALPVRRPSAWPTPRPTWATLAST